ncbi:MAG TPA: type II toxin-antitoxin system Phd/YefM family antitoxin [Candidatus Eisenbergiella merdipullorum]|uniref:Type II toxin-antitoxin system Phd/YefM family antitoxin n=1 Tax=Candidatus Eisenbergiella merdipullorum TaxID=2838553 RepID=A0A9D2L0B4_9FIRM|nr:type II toxin-antitoxin system Phd/YefM family antitoxin [Candidatus Eisenbergiella merdipullorum]
MELTANFLTRLIPISQFNKGQASKIFDRLRSEPELIVLKNNQPSAVIFAPDEYIRLAEIEEDYNLLIGSGKMPPPLGNKGTNLTGLFKIKFHRSFHMDAISKFNL